MIEESSGALQNKSEVMVAGRRVSGQVQALVWLYEEEERKRVSRPSI